MTATPKKTRGTATTLIIRIAKMLTYGAVGAGLMLFVVGVFVLNNKPDLSPWHTAELDEEYTISSKVNSFTEYLELEERLFAQLQSEVYDKVAQPRADSIHRYHSGSQADPGRWPTNWNRSYELPTDPATGPPTAGVLLIHGLTDSPYSLRHIGATLHQQGARILSLRVPGHGTAPASLVDTSWQDMASAVQLAVQHLHEKIGDAPLYVVGYSNGGALALHYTLSTLENADLPAVDGLALISPEIGVDKVAAIAIWQERVGKLLHLDKLSWTSTNVEYDPYKYVSFPVNGGVIAHDLTAENRNKITALATQDKMENFPPLIAFQSVVDATVSAPALVKDLFDHLPSNQSELVAFDLNRREHAEDLLTRDPKDDIGLILDNPSRRFLFSVLTNAAPDRPDVVRRVWQPGSSQFEDTPLPLQWPADVYSLAHVSLPMPVDDPLYGDSLAIPSPGIQIGAIALKGERGVLHISAADMLRLRWNPFYDHLEGKIVEHFQLSPATTEQ